MGCLLLLVYVRCLPAAPSDFIHQMIMYIINVRSALTMNRSLRLG